MDTDYEPIFIAADEFFDAIDEKMGFCTNCQDFTRDSTPIDVKGRVCPMCHQDTVFGAGLAMEMGWFEIES